MKISIFGLGYVGCVGIGCMAYNGHHMIGVDTSTTKVNYINSGKSTIIEKEIDQLIKDGYTKNLIRATTDYLEAVKESDISFLCVGTPSSDNGHLDLQYIYQTAEQIGKALQLKNTFHIIVIRSTVFPGTNKRVSDIIESVSKKRCNVDFAVVSNPEFLREGTAVQDYLNPPLTVLGSKCNKAIEIIKELYKHTKAPIEIVSIEVAEMIKYVNNSFHALKIVFANEVGNICKELNIDSHEVMRIFCMDTQLNISPYYFKPGFAYGGSCLPKDLKGLNTLSHDLYLNSPVLNAINESNENHIQRVIHNIEKTGKHKIGILGLSFKSDTDDMRNSPIIKVIEILHGKGIDVMIYDKNVSLSRLIGKNKSVISSRLPHLNMMLKDKLEDVTDWSDLLVITNNDAQFRNINLKPNQQIFDLVRIQNLENEKNYNGLCW